LKLTPAITQGLKLFTQLEAMTLAGTEGHRFSTQRARLGLDLKGYQLGAAADLTESGTGPEIGYNIGGFVQKEF
jgi:hypothetical protein